MTYVKRSKSGGVEITSAALTLSGLEEQEFFEVQTLDGAVVLLSTDTERHELTDIVNELIRLAKAIMRDIQAECENEPEEETILFPSAILTRAGLDGDEIHVICDEGIVMIVGKEHDFSLTPHTRERLNKHGITHGHFDCLLKRVREENA